MTFVGSNLSITRELGAVNQNEALQRNFRGLLCHAFQTVTRRSLLLAQSSHIRSAQECAQDTSRIAQIHACDIPSLQFEP
jgi:hypothetical protein